MNSQKEILRFFNIFLISPQSRSEIERLIRDLKSRANKLDCLFQLSQAISNISEMDQFLNLIVNSISEVMNAERVSLVFFNSKTGKYELKKKYWL